MEDTELDGQMFKQMKIPQAQTKDYLTQNW